MGLFKPAWQKTGYKNREKAIAAVNRISDQNMLCEIALTAPMQAVQQAAAEKITDQKLLHRIVRENKEWDVQRAAFAKITDTDIIKDIAMNTTYFTDEYKLIERFSDNKDLLELAAGAKNPEVSKAVIRKLGYLKDKDSLMYLIESETPGWMKALAIKEIRNKALQKGRTDNIVREIIRDSSGWYTEGLRWFEPSKEDLKRIYTEAVREDIRADALGVLVSDPLMIPSEMLSKIYLDAENKRLESIGRNDHTLADHWSGIKKSVVFRLEKSGYKRPALIADMMREIDDLSFRETCSRILFRDELDSVEGIEGFRDEAVSTYISTLENMVAKEPDSHRRKVTEAQFICQFANMLPEKARKKYGFSVSREETRDSDEFGDYTYTQTTVSYKGHTYRN